MTGYIPQPKDLEYFARISKAGAQRAKEFFQDAYSPMYVSVPPFFWGKLAEQFEATMEDEFRVDGPVYREESGAIEPAVKVKPLEWRDGMEVSARIAALHNNYVAAAIRAAMEK